MAERAVQSLNTPLAIVVTLFGISMLLRAEQSRNADCPISFTVSGIVTLASDVHPSKALSLIEPIPSGRTMPERAVQF